MELQRELPADSSRIALQSREADAACAVLDAADGRFLRGQALGDLVLREAGLFASLTKEGADFEVGIAGLELIGEFWVATGPGLGVFLQVAHDPDLLLRCSRRRANATSISCRG